MDDVKKAYAWQEAIELSKQIVAVCEEFRDPDDNVLVWHLRQAMVDIPSGVAADLQAGRPAAMEPMVKLATVLELVDRVYPAIDTAKAEERFDKLWQRMASKEFGEREAEQEDQGAQESALKVKAQGKEPEEEPEPIEEEPAKEIEITTEGAAAKDAA